MRRPPPQLDVLEFDEGILRPAQSEESEEFRKAYEAEQLRYELIQERQRAKLTQAEVARRMGVSQPRVAEIESLRGDLRIETLLAYADAIGSRIKLVREPKARYGKK